MTNDVDTKQDRHRSSTMQPPADGIRLHIGGEEVREGWSILNIQPGPGVDYLGSCTDLSGLPDGSCAEVYASHVLEHLGYDRELPMALREIHRVLKPGGRFRLSVPDLDILCRLFVHPGLTTEMRIDVMRIMYGGRTNPYDVHQVGLTFDFMGAFLTEAGFRDICRLPEFGMFNDSSSFRLGAQLISLNLEAWK